MLHRLSATQGTISVGVIDPKAEPVIEIISGDEIVIETWTHWGDVIGPETSFEDIQGYRKSNSEEVGPHSLTGPIAVKGAKVGSELRVEMLDITMRDHGYNIRLPGKSGRGLLPEDFNEGEIKHFKLNQKSMTTELIPGIEIPLRPFLGIIAVAPSGKESFPSSTLGNYGGNIDVSELTVGSALHLPVLKEGADLRVGDAHAAQGDGEVNLMAIETAFSSIRLRLTLCERQTPKNPWAETDEHFITLGFGENLEMASKEAVREMISFLEKRFTLTASDAYTLCSISADLSITQLVNPIVGVHAKISKGIFGLG